MDKVTIEITKPCNLTTWYYSDGKKERKEREFKEGERLEIGTTSEDGSTEVLDYYDEHKTVLPYERIILKGVCFIVPLKAVY